VGPEGAMLSGRIEVLPGLWLDHRRALVMPEAGWLAVADLHYGFEVHRQIAHGALLPEFGMAEVEDRLAELMADYRVTKIILVGDIMDGSGSADLTADFLDRMEARGAELICISGNHDRSGLRSRRSLVPWHCAEGNCFLHHGHQPKEAAKAFAEVVPQPLGWTQIQGHLHPAVQVCDGAGLKLVLPALAELPSHAPSGRSFVLPAFSPWARGGSTPTATVAEWVCAKGHVWQVI
ncbi:MAG: metallophosphoesterase, partial [Verrucomicrobiales bacterium]|nr:metallophosphoesterase [Verrucomicrobiales bacterium]